jgi:hypothetical protein
MNFATVKQRVRSIIGDPDGDLLNDAYLGPMVNHVYGLEVLYLRNAGALNIEKVAVVANIPAERSDLSEYQRMPVQPTDNRPLFGLLQPYKLGVRWKQAGTPDLYYRRVQMVEFLPDYNFSTPYPAWTPCFEWRAFAFWITPFTFNIDLQVRGDFNPNPLIKETDEVQVHPNLGDVLVEQSAACVMRERANPGQLTLYEQIGSPMLDQVANLLTRSIQGLPCRVGRMNRIGRRGQGGWNQIQ